MQQVTQTPAVEGRLLTAQDLADRLSVPLQSIYGWRVAHKGPRGLRVGKYIRYRLEDVLAWEESQMDPKRTP